MLYISSCEITQLDKSKEPPESFSKAAGSADGQALFSHLSHGDMLLLLHQLRQKYHQRKIELID